MRLTDDPANKIYPMPITATAEYDVEVGRIRRSEAFGDVSVRKWLNEIQVALTPKLILCFDKIKEWVGSFCLWRPATTRSCIERCSCG